MPYRVLLTEGAARDLEQIHDYLSRHDSPAAATYVLDRIEDVMGTLSDSPKRGAYPPELVALGIREYRQVHFKPYRLIYRIVQRRVYVYLIADGRRDMQSLLAHRLLGAC